MTLQQFRVLLAVRQHGSLTRAADALHYGVPTVTHHLRALEAHLGAALVARDRSGAHLTELGTLFADEVAPVLTRIERAERAVLELRDAGAVTLRVGTFSSMGSRLIPAAIAELRGRSAVRVEVVEAEPTEVVRLVRAGEVHAGLIYHVSTEPGFVGTDLVQRSLFSEPYRVLIAKRSPLASRESLDFADLAEAAWVCSRSDDEASDRVLRRVYQSLGLPMRELMRTDDLYMIHGLVAEGLGCALTTSAAVDADFDVVLRPAKQDLGERRVSFVTRRGPMPAAVGWLGEILEGITAERR
ncbi:LysR family transcriptional regulator [Leucobacter chromiiresistens]|uniref:DNA-binding transcriptional regulator, LysR family n=1 Tax=Leucobacter chromiiresistens TaxID=1079994 RepID=A0A1H0ZGQ7_9MICO|nr:LysR family transcriptional regulator [Leucobacter chromiiresistens]SDQ26695.1 DNA-binding transcriptional regulator, LysR family [Leucobacter chromiiresistens]